MKAANLNQSQKFGCAALNEWNQLFRLKLHLHPRIDFRLLLRGWDEV